jgi:DNA-binding MarR family transcriptional regulator
MTGRDMNQRRVDLPTDRPPPANHDGHPSSDEGRVIEFGTPVIPERYLVYARRIKATRVARMTFFHASLFGEPGWDMMLALYIAEGEGRRLKVSDICNESGVPPTTALRWLDRLYDLQMARKRRHTRDHRIFFVEIHPDTTRKLNAYFELALKRHYPPI